MNIQKFVSDTSAQIQEKAKEYYQDLPPMKEGAIFSFAISFGVSVILTSNISVAVGAGLLGTTASLLDSVAAATLKSFGYTSSFDPIKELSKKSVCILAASLLLNKGQILASRAAQDILLQGILMFYQKVSSYKQEGNQFYLMLRV